jgi:fatty acid desaturase
MSDNLGRPIKVPKEKMAAFRALTEAPSIARPTLALACVVIPGVLVIDALALIGILPLIWAATLNVVLYYFFFSIIHDGVHRAISANKRVNDLICQIAISSYAPFAAMPLFRWAHMEHHRFTNDENDPDDWSHGSWWSLPFRWMLIDFNYGYRALTSDRPAVKKVVRESLPYMIGGLTFIALIVALGFGYELFVLWFIPSRLAFIGIGFSFFWLPHAHWPDDEVNLKQSDNYTIATTLRLGGERILNPLLQYQNYHLIHHLWPTTPFYNNEQVWKLLEPELRVRDLAVAEPFAIQPEYAFAAHTEQGAAHA